MVLNKRCLTCNTKFSYCPDCSKVDALKPAWASQFCCESCATIWSTLTKFNMNRLTKSEVKDIISNLELKPIESYAACVKRDYEKLMHEDEDVIVVPMTVEIKEIDVVVETELATQNKSRKRHRMKMTDEPVVEQLEEIIESVVIKPEHEVVIIENE